MIDWSLPPDLQEKYDKVVADTRRLQLELGITPMTMEERYQAYLRRKADEARRQEELKKIQQTLSQRRPPPRWKV